MKKRNGFYYKDDKEYVSVTKVLGDVLAKPALYYWFKQQAARIALRNPELSEKEVISMVDLVSSASKERGHFVHSIAESMPNVNIDEIQTEFKGYIQALKNWWDTFNPKNSSNEIELFSDTHMIAGRCDKLLNIGSDIFVINIKTGKSIYDEVELQLSAYKFMIEEMGLGENIKMAVLLLKEDGSYIFSEVKYKMDIFIHLLEVWKWKKE